MLPTEELNGENQISYEASDQHPKISRPTKPFLPPEVIAEIISRISVKSLLKVRRQGNFQQVNMYSLKNDSWRIIESPWNCNMGQLISSSKFVNGKLHWATIVGSGLERVWGITSFDLAYEKWRKFVSFHKMNQGHYKTEGVRSTDDCNSEEEFFKEQFIAADLLNLDDES
ncbi:hypothetical protein H5410_001601 [Solanum commersonii]|uniref:F-box associated beta-propeller type 1 domain-containing protein n=1 Tax=Solanum commersonii TaxID=4109 RepID=A0A9J6AZM1_SOLCO|nr:hypothetical protein H5410_001601 [Solanum commersonii]